MTIEEVKGCMRSLARLCDDWDSEVLILAVKELEIKESEMLKAAFCVVRGCNLLAQKGIEADNFAQAKIVYRDC